MLSRIAHTTDFSPQSAAAFIHALALALVARGRLDILHVSPSAEDDWQSFPHVREVLIGWGLLAPQSDRHDIANKLGVNISKVEINHSNVITGVSEFLMTHRPNLLVVATHGRQGVNRWLHGSVSEAVVRQSHVPTLLIGPGGHGFVSTATGEIRLRRVLVPVTEHPAPARQLALLVSLFSELGVAPNAFTLVHIADDPRDATQKEAFADVECLSGPVVETILSVADERCVDLIAMSTSRRPNLLEALRGRTTSRVVAEAPCPVLLLPDISISTGH
jgi:nucleotide-binding universal stress UspA family protein